MRVRLIRVYFNQQHSRAALNLIATFQTCFSHPLPVDKRTVGGTQVAQKTTRRRYLEHAVMTGEKLIFGETKVGVLSSSD